MSSYPFNNDGLTECRIASDILYDGDIRFSEDSYYFDTHSVLTPAYNVLLAFVSSIVEHSPYDVAQVVTALLSVLTIVGTYLIAYEISGSTKGAIASALTLGMLGTFVFLTGSTWKASLGVALLVFLAYLHMKRVDRRMLLLSVVTLGILPIVHHLVALIAYLAIAYATGVSFATALSKDRLGKGHFIDIITVAILSTATFIYYSTASLDRLESLTSGLGYLLIILIFAGLLLITLLVARRTRHWRYSLAPLSSAIIFVLVLWDFHNPLFPYSGGYPQFILLLGIIIAIVVGIAWFGMELLLKSDSVCRLLPLIWLLPVATILLFAILNGSTTYSHQVVYRSFDFGFFALALAIAGAIAGLKAKPMKQNAFIVGLVAVLLVSFPFSYLTETLEGIRHDTQEYEVDAISWVYQYEGPDSIIQSDERISYTGRALFDFDKRPYVPTYIKEFRFPSERTLNLLLLDWSVKGVNDYPNGFVILDEATVNLALEVSSIAYVRGPVDHTIIVYRSSEIGRAYALP